MEKSSETMNNLTIPTQEGQGSSLTEEEVPISLNFLETDDDSESTFSPERLVIDENECLKDKPISSHRQLDFSEDGPCVKQENFSSPPSSLNMKRITEKQNSSPNKEKINHFWLSCNKEEKQIDPQKVLKRLSFLNRKINRMNKRISKIQLDAPKNDLSYKTIKPTKNQKDQMEKFRSKLKDFLSSESIKKEFDPTTMFSEIIHLGKLLEHLKASNKPNGQKFEVFDFKHSKSQ